MTLRQIMLITALILFLVATAGASVGRVSLVAAGLAALTASMLL